MKRRKSIEKIAAVLLASAVALSELPAVRAGAAEPNTPKEEVVYINLNADGSVKEVNVVNIFELSEDGEITDYGRYESLRNMTTTDEIEYSDGEVKIGAKAGKLYYEGKAAENTIPWDIGVTYYLDGAETSAAELAGKSGALRIHLSIAENKNCRGGFFESYALQASLTLDTKKCSDIIADGATVANVGSDKQITYTVLPGKGLEADVSADVTDFEMAGLSINGIPLKLNVEIDSEELSGRVAELQDALKELDDGAKELNDGVSKLKGSAEESLKSGTSKLYGGAKELQSGLKELEDGGTELQSGAGELQSGADTLDKGVNDLKSGIEQIGRALDELNSKSGELRGGSAEFKEALSTLYSALGGVSASSQGLYALTDASAQIKTGIGSLTEGARALKSAVSFEGYKAVMLQNGLDIDVLKQNNTDAAAALRNVSAALNEKLPLLQMFGIDTSTLTGLMTQLEDVALLLEADSAAVDGAGAYLDAVNGNISTLLDGAETLQTGYEQFDGAISSLVSSLSGMAYKVSELSSAVSTLVSEYEKLDGGISAYTDGVAQIVAGYSQISDGAAELAIGSGALKEGADSLYGATGELLSGIKELYSGSGSLKDGAGALDEGVSELIAGIDGIYGGTGELKDGTGSVKDATSGMDTEIEDRINGLLDSITGGNKKTESFISELNTNIKSVQFVIQTEGISKAKEEIVSEASPEPTLWQKFLKLFGLYREKAEADG